MQYTFLGSKCQYIVQPWLETRLCCLSSRMTTEKIKRKIDDRDRFTLVYNRVVDHSHAKLPGIAFKRKALLFTIESFSQRIITRGHGERDLKKRSLWALCLSERKRNNRILRGHGGSQRKKEKEIVKWNLNRSFHERVGTKNESGVGNIGGGQSLSVSAESSVRDIT